MFDNLRAAYRLIIKESRSWRAILSLGFHGPLWMSASYEAFAREGYTWNPDVYSCIKRSTDAMRGFRFKVYRKSGAGWKEVTQGPLFDLLARPNPRQSFGALAAEWYGSLEVSGNGYIEGVAPGPVDAEVIKRPPRELFCLRPDRMFVVPGDLRVPIAGYQYRAGSVVVDYKAQLWRDPRSGGLRPRIPVLHSKYWHPLDDFYGLAPIQAASRNIDAQNSAIAWNVGLVQNGAKPSGLFTTESPLTTTQINEYTDIVRQKFGGPGNAGRPMVLGSSYTWTQLGLNPTEMDWLNGMKWGTDKIASCYGLAPEIIGSTNRTYENVANARKAAYLEKWIPAADSLCDDLNVWLVPLFSAEAGEELAIKLDRDAIEAIQEDRQIKWQNAKDGAGFLMVDEQRALLGYQPLPNGAGQVVMVPSVNVPLQMSGQQLAQPKPKPGQPAKSGKKSVYLPLEIEGETIMQKLLEPAVDEKTVSDLSRMLASTDERIGELIAQYRATGSVEVQ